MRLGAAGVRVGRGGEDGSIVAMAAVAFELNGTTVRRATSEGPRQGRLRSDPSESARRSGFGGRRRRRCCWSCPSPGSGSTGGGLTQRPRPPWAAAGLAHRAEAVQDAAGTAQTPGGPAADALQAGVGGQTPGVDVLNAAGLQVPAAPLQQVAARLAFDAELDKRAPWHAKGMSKRLGVRMLGNEECPWTAPPGDVLGGAHGWAGRTVSSILDKPRSYADIMTTCDAFSIKGQRVIG